MAGIGRRFFLRVARSPNAGEWARRWGSGVARRFVAGDTLADALDTTLALNARGFAVSLDHLGESVRDAGAARAAADEYVRAVAAIRERAADANVSLKLTQMGLDVDRRACRENVERVLAAAKDHGVFVRIDMESSAYVDRTLGLYRDLRAAGFDNVGVVLQAYLRRSPADLRSLAPLRPDIRIVKGAYEEPPDRAFQGREPIRRAYRDLLREALGVCSRVAVATHDDSLVMHAQALARTGERGQARLEFQMLYGVRPELAERVREGGFRVRIYLPYGEDWFPYFMRRLAERPSDAWTFARQLLLPRARP